MSCPKCGQSWDEHSTAGCPVGLRPVVLDYAPVAAKIAALENEVAALRRELAELRGSGLLGGGGSA